MNLWMIFGMMLSSSLLAQQVTNAPAAAPIETPAPAAMVTNTLSAQAPGTNAPAAKSEKKKAAPKKKTEKKPVAKKKEPVAELRTVPLVPGPAVVDAKNVNVRGQPRLKSEVLTRLTKGQTVTVIEEITRNNSGADEPSAWAKIYLPTNAHAWVSTHFIDGTSKTVSPKKLNLRSGPGENFSVIGQLLHGDAVKEISSKGDWTEIEAPTNTYAFVAAQYLKQEAPGAIAATAATTPAEPAPTPTPVTENPTIAAAPTGNPAPTASTETPGATNTLAETGIASSETSTNEPSPVAVEEPPPKRIVQREGFVRGTVSIQAPTRFALVSPENGRMIDYLYTSSPNLDLRRYKGMRIVVTGEEGLDDRWGNTPVITIQKIQVVE